MFVYELSGCAFESSCSYLKFRFRACFKLGAPWHSSNYRVWIHSERRIWHDKNIQTVLKLRFKFLFHVTWALISLTLVQNLISSQGTAVADNYFTWCPSLFPPSSKKNSQTHQSMKCLDNTLYYRNHASIVALAINLGWMVAYGGGIWLPIKITVWLCDLLTNFRYAIFHLNHLFALYAWLRGGRAYLGAAGAAMGCAVEYLWGQQWLAGYLRVTLVFVWNSVQRKEFSFCFSTVFS